MVKKPPRAAQRRDYDEQLSSRADSTHSEEEIEDTGLTENQNRVLYLIHLYSSHAATVNQKDTWIRKQALIVLIYEGIVTGSLDYDYAPQSVSVQNRRIWMNVSQEGKSDIEFLREEELVNGLQIPARSVQPITCYQISQKGLELIRRISKREKDLVHEFVFARGTDKLLTTFWDGSYFYLVAGNGAYRRRSTITDVEDVSFVSSAYIPQCLRYGGRPTLSNGHRAHECSVSSDNIRDVLDEVITLNTVSIIVAEYIPFGANQIVQLNINVGSAERNQGGFISPMIADNSTEETQLQMNPALTSVNILDYSLTNHINFEAEINLSNSLPSSATSAAAAAAALASASGNERESLIQVETFGVSLNAEGTCFYGLQVEAVLDRIKDNISLDHLSRLLVAVQQDSSAIVDTIISQYQREMLQLVFLGDAENRNKVNLIIANEITPHLTAEEYMDKGEYENELKQVIGDTKAAYDISEHDTLIFGSHGLLVAGPNSRHHEPLLCAYLQFITIDIFLQNFFTRLWILDDDMQTTNQIILHGEKDPNALERIQYRICKLSNDIITLEEILSYILEALDIIHIPPEPPEQAGRALYERLEIGGMKNQLLRRGIDMKKNIHGSHRFLDVLREMTSVVAESKMFKLNETMNVNTGRMCSLQDSNERTAVLLVNIQSIFSGILAFNILDRLTGSWSVADSFWFQSIYRSVIEDVPLLWFVVSLLVWAAVLYVLNRIYGNSYYMKQGMTTVRCKINRRILLARLQIYLQSKVHSYEERHYDDNNDIVRITYTEQSNASTANAKAGNAAATGSREQRGFSKTISLASLDIGYSTSIPLYQRSWLNFGRPRHSNRIADIDSAGSELGTGPGNRYAKNANGRDDGGDATVDGPQAKVKPAGSSPLLSPSSSSSSGDSIWGSARPVITLEYDERNSYLLSASIQYNRRESLQTAALTADEIREKIIISLNEAGIWDIEGDDQSREDLAIDRRAAQQRVAGEVAAGPPPPNAFKSSSTVI